MLSASLYSCSSDDEIVKPSEDAKLNVQVEQLLFEDNTRAGYSSNGNKLYWHGGDAINVYDDKLMTYDEYTFNPVTSLFTTSNTNTEIDGPISYALFPANMVDYAGWTTRGNRAVINLPTTIVYDGSIENTSIVSGQTLYLGRLPMWGTATGSFGSVSIKLKYLCAVMKLKVTKSKATFVKIASATKTLSGGVEAVISKNGVTEQEPTIKKGTGALGAKNYVLLDLRQMPSAEGYVYVPIIPDTYDDLKVLYTTLDIPVGTTMTDAQIADADEMIWSPVKVYPSGKQFKRSIAYFVGI